jgi:hypothetical protein
MKWVSMAEQPHISLRSPCAMPSVGWSDVKPATIGLWSSGNTFSGVMNHTSLSGILMDESGKVLGNPLKNIKMLSVEPLIEGSRKNLQSSKLVGRRCLNTKKYEEILQSELKRLKPGRKCVRNYNELL